MAIMCKLLLYVLAVSFILFMSTGYVGSAFAWETLGINMIFSVHRTSYFAMLIVSALSVPLSLFAIVFRRVRGIHIISAFLLLLGSLAVLIGFLL